MRWLVVRFQGRDKTPSIIDWDRQQRPSHRQATSRAARPSLRPRHHDRRRDGRQRTPGAASDGHGRRQGRRKAVQRAGSAGLSGPPAHGRPRGAACRAIGHGPTETSRVVGSPNCSPNRWWASLRLFPPDIGVSPSFAAIFGIVPESHSAFATKPADAEWAMFQKNGGDATTGCVTDRQDKLVDGTDHGRDARAVVDLLHEGADCLHYFRCRARVACPDQLAYLVAAALPDTRHRGCQSGSRHQYMGQRPLLVTNTSLIRAIAASRQVPSSIRSGICLGSCWMVGG
jgi:hypothetical protein